MTQDSRFKNNYDKRNEPHSRTEQALEYRFKPPLPHVASAKNIISREISFAAEG